MLRMPLACNDLAAISGFVEATHRFVGAGQGDIQMGAGRLNVRMAEHVLHLMQGPVGLQKPTPGLVPQVVKVEIANPRLPTGRLEVLDSVPDLVAKYVCVWSKQMTGRVVAGHLKHRDLPPLNRSRSRVRISGGRRRTEQIVSKLRQAEVELSRGLRVPLVCKKLGISEQTYYRWRKEYGGLRLDQAKRLKELERENTRLKKLVADQALDNAILKEVTSGNF